MAALCMSRQFPHASFSGRRVSRGSLGDVGDLGKGLQ